MDVARNLDAPIAEMDLPVTVETRTGDTPAARRQRQRHAPPDILLTTPEQLGLLLAHPRAPQMFETLKTVVLDEIACPLQFQARRSAGAGPGAAHHPGARPSPGRAFRHGEGSCAAAALPDAAADERRGFVRNCYRRRAAPNRRSRSARSGFYVPWAGHLARHAMADVMLAIHSAKTALVFVNTRSQAERTFQELWAINDANLPIALHHGSLAPEQRRKVEAAMAKGNLRAVVCTSTLDLGIDWGAVDKVICIGAPKAPPGWCKRIGRANHRLDEPSAALLVPANRFEGSGMQCGARCGAGGRAGWRAAEGRARWMCWRSMCWARACAAPFRRRRALRRGPQRFALCASDARGFRRRGGFRRHGRLCAARPTIAMRACAKPRRENSASPIPGWRRNIASMPASSSKTRWWRSGCRARDAPPVRAGANWASWRSISSNNCRRAIRLCSRARCCASRACAKTGAFVTRTDDPNAEIPSYNGGKFPLSTFLAQRVREMVSNPESWSHLPDPVQEWLKIQEWRSVIP